jgi:outer membrane protein assembly factor BamE (lipoprotein component of BamABCDE complex)
MRHLKFPALCLMMAMLSSCSILEKDNRPASEIAKNQILGITKDETFTCLGPPTEKSVAGQIERWTYIYNKTCKTDLTIASDNRVKAVDYSHVPDKDAKPWEVEDLTMEEHCEHVPQIISCVHWLRH